MADILTLVFRTFMSDSGLKKTTTPGPPPSTAGGSALLVGDPSTSRSLLLLAAVTAASELGARVVFFSQTQIQSLPVSLQTRVPSLSPESLKVNGTSLPVESTSVHIRRHFLRGYKAVKTRFSLLLICVKIFMKNKPDHHWNWTRLSDTNFLLSALICKTSHKRPSEEDLPLFPVNRVTLLSFLDIFLS